MFVSPKTLKHFCLDFCAQNLPKDVKLPLREPHLSPPLAEELLEALREVTDHVLNDPLFSCQSTRLTRVRIRDASQLSVSGLRSLRGHRLDELWVNGLKKCSINELIGCLGEYSLNNLKSLNVSQSSFTSDSKLCVVIGLAKLRSLRHLDVSRTDFNDHGLEIVAQDLPLLQSLNIGETRVKDITCLRRLKGRLKWLSIFNLREDHVTTLLEFTMLKHLDVSLDANSALDPLFPRAQDCTTDILKHPKRFLELEQLDLSGREDIIIEDLKRFLEFKRNNGIPLKFLGLLNCPQIAEEFVLEEDLVVCGSASLDQLKRCLEKYYFRQNFIQKTLFSIYNYTLSPMKTDFSLISLIIRSMNQNIKQIGVCMAGSACLYNLTKNQLGEEIHPKLLSRVTRVTLHAMRAFPSHQQLQKNCLLTLCSDRILQSVAFDRFECTRLVLDSLVQFKDAPMNRMSVAIVSILAAKISTEETSLLGQNSRYMNRLLNIVRERVQTQHVVDHVDGDVTLKFTLSALWNLTDESARTCHVFVERGGLELYLEVLKRFSNETSIETKVLGLLNNISEVNELKRHLLTKTQLIQLIRALMMRTQELDVSYFSVGILAHLLASDHVIPELEAFSADMRRAVLSWAPPEAEMVAYRSFLPFLPLLDCLRVPSVQLWALWAINHVISRNPKRYCEMLVKENGIIRLKKIISSDLSEEETKKLSWLTLEIVEKEFPNIC